MKLTKYPARYTAITLSVFLLAVIVLAACGNQSTPAPTPAPTLTPIPPTATAQLMPTPTPDLQVPVVAPILPEAAATPITTPVPVPVIQVQSPLLEAPDLTSNIYVEYILDASGSMMGQLADHTRKRDVAQTVLTARLQSFPAQIHIGFRSFGHNMDWRGREAASCQDIELIAPVQTGQLETIAVWLKGFVAQGMTPLAQSIRYAVEDLPKAGEVNNAIVLISDGEETCGGDPCAVVNQLRQAGIHFTLHVVGMNVQPGDAEQLLCVARAGQGFYKPVQTAQELNQALEEIERHIAAGNAPVIAQMPTPAPTPIPPTATPVPPMLTPTPSLGIGSTMISPIDGMEMVFVPAGDFTMGGSPGVGFAEEQPVHTVSLSAYWIDRTEVTSAMMQRFVNETGYPARFYTISPNHPAINMNWSDAVAYCDWAGRRLPTEAEWEKAARGTDARMYPWGNAITGAELAYCDANCRVSPEGELLNDGLGLYGIAPVGSYPQGASPYGALDMAGNVSEWVADWYDSTYYARSPSIDPIGPESGSKRVQRGGRWHPEDWTQFRTSFRGFQDPDGWSGSSPGLGGIGFRCAVRAGD